MSYMRLPNHTLNWKIPKLLFWQFKKSSFGFFGHAFSKMRLDFSDMLSLRCSMIYLYVFSFYFLISNCFCFLIASSSTVYSTCWTVMRLISSAAILRELLYSTSACSWQIEIANLLYLVGKYSNLRSSSLHIRPPVVAGMSRFQTAPSIGINKLLISGIVLMK